MLLRLLSEEAQTLLVDMSVPDRPGADTGEQRQEHEDGAVVPQPVRLGIPPAMSPLEHHDQRTHDGEHVTDDQQGDPAVLQTGGHGTRRQMTVPRRATSAGRERDKSKEAEDQKRERAGRGRPAKRLPVPSFHS